MVLCLDCVFSAVGESEEQRCVGRHPLMPPPSAELQRSAVGRPAADPFSLSAFSYLLFFAAAVSVYFKLINQTNKARRYRLRASAH